VAREAVCRNTDRYISITLRWQVSRFLLRYVQLKEILLVFKTQHAYPPNVEVSDCGGRQAPGFQNTGYRPQFAPVKG
jgi:hypothetical protein